MVYKYSRIILVSMLCIAFSVQMNAQSGISFTAGVAAAKNQLNTIYPSGATSTGYTGAAEARFLGQDMYFVVQMQYAKYKLLPTSGFEFFTENNNFQVIHGKIGMGFTLFRLGYNTIIRAKVLGCLDKNLQYTSAAIAHTDFKKMNDATLGMLVGVGLDLKWFVLDIEYERGLINAFYKVPGSNFDYFSIRTGFLIN